MDKSLHPTVARLYERMGITGAYGEKNALAKKIGLSSPTILLNWEKRGISMAGLVQIGQKLGIGSRYLVTGIEDEKKPIEITDEDYPPIKRVRFKLSAGVSGFAIDVLDDEAAPIVFQRGWYESRGLVPSKLFAVRVTGASMEPGLSDGDTVVVNTGQNAPKDGVVFAVNYEGELVIKRMVRDEGLWWLSSDNPDKSRYQRKRCHEAVFILGQVVHKQSEVI